MIALAVVGIISTPLIWLLGGHGPGELAAATVQGAVSIAALVWALFQRPDEGGATDEVKRSGAAETRNGGGATTGVRRPGGRGRGSAHVVDSGDATADGRGSKAVSGIDYS
ncbi:hypothetical protein [Streptomyces sp. NPDC001404]|uniref:hypothetical protein n=1 Tax=Streptomyces sp. NPDC001404 TaxID=3364571 RepID=UPI0036BF08FC